MPLRVGASIPLPLLYELKIDKTLVDEIHENPDAAALAELIIATARRLGLRIVAEGVETEGQAEYLLETGSDVIQGYWMTRLMPIEQWLSGRELSPVTIAQTNTVAVRYS